MIQILVTDWSVCLNKLHAQFCGKQIDHVIDMSDHNWEQRGAFSKDLDPDGLRDLDLGHHHTTREDFIELVSKIDHHKRP